MGSYKGKSVGESSSCKESGACRISGSGLPFRIDFVYRENASAAGRWGYGGGAADEYSQRLPPHHPSDYGSGSGAYNSSKSYSQLDLGKSYKDSTPRSRAYGSRRGLGNYSRSGDYHQTAA